MTAHEFPPARPPTKPPSRPRQPTSRVPDGLLVGEIAALWALDNIRVLLGEPMDGAR